VRDLEYPTLKFTQAIRMDGLCEFNSLGYNSPLIFIVRFIFIVPTQIVYILFQFV